MGSENLRQVEDDVKSFARELREDRHAKNALDYLTHRGVPRARLLSLLLRIPRASRKGQLVQNMSDRALWNLPRRINRWADLIERVSASPHLDPNFLKVLHRSESRLASYRDPLNKALGRELIGITVEHFDRLPLYLRLYGLNLAERLKTFRGQDWRQLQLGRRPHEQLWLTLLLIKLVRDATKGNSHYAKLAELLTLAYTACGKPKEVTEDGLSKLERDNPWAADLVFRPGLFRDPDE